MFKNTPYGFHMDFTNGWLISVQWGPHNYCSTRTDEQYADDNPFDGNFHEYASNTAEIAVWHKDADRYYPLSDTDDVKGWVSTQEVTEYIEWVSQLDSNYVTVLENAPYKGLHGVSD